MSKTHSRSVADGYKSSSPQVSATHSVLMVTNATYGLKLQAAVAKWKCAYHQ